MSAWARMRPKAPAVLVAVILDFVVTERLDVPGRSGGRGELMEGQAFSPIRS
jgi:hypothetical protein